VTTATASLAEQRRLLRDELGAQRQRLAQQLAAAAAGGLGSGYPRSVTMRWLMDEPALVTKLVQRLVGARVAGAVPAVLAVARFLRSAVAL
jgi:hypothetical protein